VIKKREKRIKIESECEEKIHEAPGNSPHTLLTIAQSTSLQSMENMDMTSISIFKDYQGSLSDTKYLWFSGHVENKSKVPKAAGVCCSDILRQHWQHGNENPVQVTISAHSVNLETVENGRTPCLHSRKPLVIH
jgi:hypothetical protein